MGNFTIPPLFFYVFGAMLMIFGGLRAYFLGWKQRPEPEGPVEKGGEVVGAGADEDVDVDDDVAPVETPARGGRGGWSRSAGGGYKRHVFMGLLWVAMGLFLLISTAINN